ncbi:hypothetical protein B0H63DRAFT_460872 [Podospora didyma]|uniref:Uncharacterized protein n=1 Tax=Podospora didyma TaxID=330526 RepID=A0AAE0P6S8_9PEZI|nr:hypothetical protein B0H63DRAFT_460872 [Podospora didyma]
MSHSLYVSLNILTLNQTALYFLYYTLLIFEDRVGIGCGGLRGGCTVSQVLHLSHRMRLRRSKLQIARGANVIEKKTEYSYSFEGGNFSRDIPNDKSVVNERKYRLTAELKNLRFPDQKRPVFLGLLAPDIRPALTQKAAPIEIEALFLQFNDGTPHHEVLYLLNVIKGLSQVSRRLPAMKISEN